METENQEVAALVAEISRLHAAISKLPSLRPSPEVNALFTELVQACIPPSPVDVRTLGPEAHEMRQDLVRLCADAEGHLEAHYSDTLAATDSPRDRLPLFPYYSGYLTLSRLEHGLLARHAPLRPAARLAFLGSGPLPLSPLFLAAHHLPDALFDGYDRCAAANDEGVRARLAFHTADVAALTGELAAYDAVFLGALVGVAPEEKAAHVALLGKHMCGSTGCRLDENRPV